MEQAQRAHINTTTTKKTPEICNAHCTQRRSVVSHQRFHIMKMHEIECKTIKLIKNFRHVLDAKEAK